MGNKLFSTGEAARELGVARDAVVWALRSGAPKPRTRLAGRRVFTEAEILVLRNWFDERRRR